LKQKKVVIKEAHKTFKPLPLGKEVKWAGAFFLKYVFTTIDFFVTKSAILLQ
jgi:hypothetical protein